MPVDDVRLDRQKIHACDNNRHGGEVPRRARVRSCSGRLFHAHLLVRLLDELVGVGRRYVKLALAISGEDWLNTLSTACAPFGSIIPVSEYIGSVFFSAAR